MIIETFTTGPLDTNTYILACSKTSEACVIDAPQESLSLIQKSLAEQGLNLTRLLLTHSHLDHIADAFLIKEAFEIPVYVHAKDAQNLVLPGSDKIALFLPVKGLKADGFFQEGDVIKVGHLEIEVLETPGHSPGGVCFYLRDQGVLFSGDTLFKRSMGRVDFPHSSPADMWDSLKRLSKLPAETRVYPGHGPATTIGDEPWLDRASERL